MRDRLRVSSSFVMLELRVPRFPFGQLDAIARQRFVVQVENARRAAAVAAVFQFGLFGRGRTRIVGERIRGGRLGHGFSHMMSNAQYTVMDRGMQAAGRMQPCNLLIDIAAIAHIPRARFRMP